MCCRRHAKFEHGVTNHRYNTSHGSPHGAASLLRTYSEEKACKVWPFERVGFFIFYFWRVRGLDFCLGDWGRLQSADCRQDPQIMVSTKFLMCIIFVMNIRVHIYACRHWTCWAKPETSHSPISLLSFSLILMVHY
jgi:hypothetical protein